MLSLKWMPGIYSFPLTDAQQLFYASTRPWSQHRRCVCGGTQQATLPQSSFSVFFNLNVSVCLLSSLLWAFKHFYCVLWKSYISINSGVTLLPVSSMEALVSKGSFVDKMFSTAFLHIQREQSTNQALGDNTCNYVCRRRFMMGLLGYTHTHKFLSVHHIWSHREVFSPRICFFPSVFCVQVLR